MIWLVIFNVVCFSVTVWFSVRTIRLNRQTERTLEALREKRRQAA